MIQAVERACAILRAVQATPGGIRLMPLAEELGLHKSTVHHLAETLVEQKLLDKNAEGAYQFGPFWLEIPGPSAPRDQGRQAAGALLPFCRSYPKISLHWVELGKTDLFLRFRMEMRRNPAPQFVADETLNPYLSVAGILFFALASEDRLTALRSRHPFESEGLETWGKEANFLSSVAEARGKGYSESPRLVRPDAFKFALPHRLADGTLGGALVCYAERKGLPPPAQLRKDLLAILKTLP